MRKIPAGKTLTYGELAGAIGSSARAVGSACGQNPIPALPRWTVELEKLSGAYSANLRTEVAPGGKAQKVTDPTLFSGFTQPFLTSPGESKWSFAHRLRALDA